MRTSVSMVGVFVAAAMGSSSAPLSAGPVTMVEMKPITSNARIVVMQRKLDRFEARRDLDASRLYVSRERAGVRVAQAPESRSSRYNR
jgi:hypothetical protein